MLEGAVKRILAVILTSLALNACATPPSNEPGIAIERGDLTKLSCAELEESMAGAYMLAWAAEEKLKETMVSSEYKNDKAKAKLMKETYTENFLRPILTIYKNSESHYMARCPIPPKRVSQLFKTYPVAHIPRLGGVIGLSGSAGHH
jgi:hypothetical protein